MVGSELVEGVDQAVGAAHVVPCSRPARTPRKTQNGQPSGTEMTCTFPPGCSCFPDHQGWEDSPFARSQS